MIVARTVTWVIVRQVDEGLLLIGGGGLLTVGRVVSWRMVGEGDGKAS